MILALLLAVAAPAATKPVAPLESFQTETLAAKATGQKAARLWATAGNVRLAGGDATGAIRDFDQALAIPSQPPLARGETLLDRARAAQATGDPKTARANLRSATPLISGDPFLWYFSAALALQENDLVTAHTAIAHALRLAPGDPTLLFEAGTIAAADGQVGAARDYWTKAAAADPRGASGNAARSSLASIDQPLTITGKSTTVQGDEALGR